MLAFFGPVKTFFSNCFKIYCVNVPKLDFQKSVSVFFLPQWISNFCVKDEKMGKVIYSDFIETTTTEEKILFPFLYLTWKCKT